MKKNRIYFIAAIILGIIAIILIFSRNKSTFRSSESQFAVDDTATVTRIFMADKNNNTLDLTRKDMGTWLVNNKYEAQHYNIKMLLSTILQLEVKSPVANAAKNNIIKDMAANSVKVEIYQHTYAIDLFDKIKLFPREKRTRVYYVGAATQDNRGTFMIRENASMPYIVYLPDLRGFVAPRFMPIEKYWRDYSVIRKSIPQIASVKMEFPGDPDNSYQVVHKNRTFMLENLNGQPLPVTDTLKLMNFLTGFRNLTFEALIDQMAPGKKDSLLSSPPYCVITLTDTAQQISRVKAFRMAPEPDAVDDRGNLLPYNMDRLYVLANNGKDFAIAQYFVFDKVLRKKSFFTGIAPSVPGKK